MSKVPAEIIDVETGEVRVSTSASVLRALALGSCVAVFAYDRVREIGGMAHIMLPGAPLLRTARGDRYASEGLRLLLDGLRAAGCREQDLEFSLIGGANVLKEGDIPERIVASVKEELLRMGFTPVRSRLGGVKPRSAYMELPSGKIYFTEGEGAPQELA